jgi:hypothetical protein
MTAPTFRPLADAAELALCNHLPSVLNHELAADLDAHSRPDLARLSPRVVAGRVSRGPAT